MEAKPRHCADCGGVLVEQMIEAEARMRSVCSRCGKIAFCNPRVLVSTLVAVADEVLLCRRAVAPAVGCLGASRGISRVR